MDLLIWSNHYSVSVDVIDEQHKKLMGLCNKLHRLIENKDADSKVQEVLSELVDYTLYHFQTEEELFSKVCYPHAKGHKAHHEKLVKEVSGVVERFNNGDTSIKETLMVFLTDWLKDHILKEDKAFGKFLSDQKKKEKSEEEL